MLKESCYDVPESECAEVARTVTETRYEEECRAVQEQKCEVRPEKKCKPMMEEVSCDSEANFIFIIMHLMMIERYAP